MLSSTFSRTWTSSQIRCPSQVNKFNSTTHKRPYTSAIDAIYNTFDQAKKDKIDRLVTVINATPMNKFATYTMLKLYEQNWLSNLYVKGQIGSLKDMAIPKEGTLERDVFIAFSWGYLMNEPEEVRISIIYYQHFLQTDPELRKAYSYIHQKEKVPAELEKAKKKILDSFEAVQSTTGGIRMIQLLIDKGRLSDIESGKALALFERFDKLITKRIDVKLTTPYILTEHELDFYTNYISNLFEGKANVNLSPQVDKSIGGGYIIEVEGKVIDYSWKKQRQSFLKKLEQSL